MIFDGTDHPSCVFTVITSEAITHRYTAEVIEWWSMRGRKKRLEPLQYGSLTVVLDNRAGTFDTLQANTNCTLALKVGTTYYAPMTQNVYEVQQVRGLNPVTIVETRDAAWVFEKTLIDAEYLNAATAEVSGVRAARISPYTVSDGGFPGTTSMLASFGSMSVLQGLQECANVEAGAFYIQRDDTPYLARVYEKLSRTVKLNFSDVDTTDTIPFQSVQTVPGISYMLSSCTVSRPSRSTAAGQATKARYLPTSVGSVGSLRWSAPVYLDESAQALAAYLIRIGSAGTDSVDILEFSGVDFMRRNSTVGWVDLLTLEIGDLITVTRSGTTYTCVVEGIKEHADTRSWTYTLFLSPYNDYTVNIAVGLSDSDLAGTFIYDTPTDWELGTAVDTVRYATSLDVKWRDFSDRGAATGTLDLYANAKQEVVYDANSTGAYQFDCKGGSATAMTTTMDVGQCVDFDVLVKCNNVAHYANSTILVDGSSVGVTTIWLGGAPVTGTVGGWDRYKIKVYQVNNAPTFRVVAQRTTT